MTDVRIFSKFFLGLAAVAVVGLGCSSPRNEQQETATTERLVALEGAMGALQEAVEENRKLVVDETRKIRASLKTMLGRGIVAAPELIKNPPKIGQMTDVGLGRAAILGPVDAPIDVVEFGDFQCPFCIRQVNFLKNLVEDYPGQVKAGYRHYPFDRKHKHSRSAARAAWAAQQQGKFWEMHDALFGVGGKLNDEVILESAALAGLNMEQFREDWDSQDATNAVIRDRRTAKAGGLRGTPTFFVNGRLIGGRPEQVRKAIERELEKAAKRSGSEKKADKTG